MVSAFHLRCAAVPEGGLGQTVMQVHPHVLRPIVYRLCNYCKLFSENLFVLHHCTYVAIPQTLRNALRESVIVSRTALDA